MSADRTLTIPVRATDAAHRDTLFVVDRPGPELLDVLRWLRDGPEG